MGRRVVTNMKLIEKTPKWFPYAACRDLDADIFFPGPGGDTDKAKEICFQCPVRRACLEYAIRNNEIHGVWGGKSERQRRKIRQARREGLEVVA